MKPVHSTRRGARLIVVAFAAIATTLPLSAQTAAPSPNVVTSFRIASQRARAALTRDAGRLWGAPLDTIPWLGVSGKTILLTAAPKTSGYTESNGIWSGPLPTTITPSNTSVTWAGRRWAMVNLPMPNDTLVAERLLIHEAMHVLQPAVLPKPAYNETDSGSAVLDEPAGRIWLRLELRALTHALRSHGAARDSAAHDALLFRAERYANESPGEITRERVLDVVEGIPEYTSWILSNSPRTEFLTTVDSAPVRMTSFVRSFEYSTGPAYGMLLDDYTGGKWRSSLSENPDVQSMLASAVAAHHASSMPLIEAGLRGSLDSSRVATLASAARTRSARYGAATIITAENTRWATRQRQLAAYKAKFVDGPTIRLRPKSVAISFDPRAQASLGAAGTYMANLAWKAADGSSLTAPDGALVNQTWTELRVPRGSASVKPGIIAKPTTIRGSGWTLVLEPGWRVTADGTSLVVRPPAAE
jgi:hypothetical protein